MVVKFFLNDLLNNLTASASTTASPLGDIFIDPSSYGSKSLATILPNPVDPRDDSSPTRSTT